VARSAQQKVWVRFISCGTDAVSATVDTQVFCSSVDLFFALLLLVVARGAADDCLGRRSHC